MKTQIYLATARSLNVIEGSNRTWRGEVRLQDQQVQCVSVGSRLKERVYCGTFGNGVYRSDDAGATWRPCKGLPNQNVMALATADGGDAGRPALLYAGTEPSAIYQSSDGGDTWHPLPGLLSLTSAGEWSFPPRPETHHVRQILSDPCFPRRLHVAIEAGALLRGEDGGETWRDRVPGGPRDTHTLAAHRSAPGRLYSAAGDGYFESLDDGDTWRRVMEGLEHGYCWSVAVSPSDPDTVLLSASKSPRAAHSKKFLRISLSIGAALMSHGAKLWTVFRIRRAAGCPSSHEMISSGVCFTWLRKASFIGQQIAALSGRNSG